MVNNDIKLLFYSYISTILC